jgi:hypothetical protein
MDPHAAYHSVCHAFCVALQATQGLATALAAVETVWDLLPPEGQSGIDALETMLHAVGIVTDDVSCAPEDIPEVVDACCLCRELILFEVRLGLGEGDQRWAFGCARSRTQIHFAVCLQPGDTMYDLDGVLRRATGRAIRLPGSMDPGVSILAHDVPMHQMEANRN